MSLNYRQFTDYIIVPSLNMLQLMSPAAVQLLLGTAVVESRLEYVKQIRGPALGVFQMEPATHDDIYENVLRYKPVLEGRLLMLAGDGRAEEMVYNLQYAAAMCRIQYYRYNKYMPEKDDYVGMAGFHKKYYNTVAGATKVEESTPIFKRIIDGGYI